MKIDQDKLDKIVSQSRKYQAERATGYREKALKLYPWICGRCSREFTPKNLRELTVHHRDHDHDNNPSDGSNWELLCLYCHDNEHQRFEEYLASEGISMASEDSEKESVKQNPFADLKAMMSGKKD
jgi:hypothetical protein